MDSLFGGAGEFDMSDMFGSSGGSIDLTKMLDPNKMNFKLPEMKDLDLDGLFDGVDMKVSTDEFNGLASRLLEGYLEYISSHPEADYANLGQYFMNYLSTDSAREIINENLMNILAQNGTFSVSDEDMKNLFREVLAGYQKYAADKGYTDPDKFDEYLLEYLQTDAGSRILSDWGSEVIDKNGNITKISGEYK